MIIYRTVGSLLVLAAFMACDGTGTAPVDPQELEWRGPISGAPGWEHLAGEAAFRWTEGTHTFTAGIILSGDEPGAIRPWHVHHNTCAQGGGIVGLDGHYGRLVIGSEGSDAVIAQVPLAIDPAARYHVNVHLSNEALEVIIACGDLVLNGPAPGEQPAPPAIPGY
jgi:superoxide dismutase, Cu-Zn family